jgi:uncharacterized GH25 family protein
MARALLTILALAGLLACAQTHAHGIYFAQRAGATTLVLGHGGDDLGYDAAKVTEFVVIDAQGQAHEAATELLRRQLSLRRDVATAPAAAWARYYGGFHGKDAQGKWHSGPRGQQGEAVQVGEYLKTALAVLRGDFDVRRLTPPSDGLAIVPLSQPLALHAGDRLRVRVMFNGKPLAGARVVEDFVNASHARGARTDSRGEASVRVRNQGLNTLAVTHTEQRKDSQADFREHLGTLSFRLDYADRH